ncbi:hypothetical protein EDD15DRAFT_1922256 [Pisolithus albus]|nr:hypothetical protein EDD15DRAFT_1922256 [Pisolithus albus]
MSYQTLDNRKLVNQHACPTHAVVHSAAAMNVLSWLKKKKKTSDRSLPSVLFPAHDYTAPIHTWASAIQILGESKHCRLRKICHYKVTGTGSIAHHEFLLVHIRHPSGREAIGRIERSPSVPTPLPLSNIHSGTTTSDQDTISLAYDGTSECLTRHLDYAQLYTLTYSKPSEAPSVAHLAALLVTLSTHGGPTTGDGCTGEHASAWYAYCVVEVLREIFSGEGKTSKNWVRVPYNGMRVDPPDRVDILVRKYTSTWQDFSRKMENTSQHLQHDPRRQNLVAHHQQAKSGPKAEMDAFADMLRKMGS